VAALAAIIAAMNAIRPVEGDQVRAGIYPLSLPSPLVTGAQSKLIDTRSVSHLTRLYAQQLGYDTADDFAGLEEIALYECEASGYQFFYPFTLEGKEALYRAIEDSEWCYEEDKWEHNAVARQVPENAKVLDIGCGRGAFLSKVVALRSTRVRGIELNKSAAAEARKRNIDVVEALIDEHAQSHPNAYDVVTAFQVLEHIADPMTFLRGCLATVKPGGLFIVAVPNNDAFISFDDLPLNQPPHHVGLWSPRSLTALASLLPVQLEALEEEPLRELDWYQQVIERRYLPKQWQRSIYYRLGGAGIVRRFIEENCSSISGHTVIARYRKH
jgi:2-polyprenyl-3-methyl-5-hydroxy-6-metoxy-1,4-benzoquinol methylase